jgi:hypothetical protein
MMSHDDISRDYNHLKPSKSKVYGKDDDQPSRNRPTTQPYPSASVFPSVENDKPFCPSHDSTEHIANSDQKFMIHCPAPSSRLPPSEETVAFFAKCISECAENSQCLSASFKPRQIRVSHTRVRLTLSQRPGLQYYRRNAINVQKSLKMTQVVLAIIPSIAHPSLDRLRKNRCLLMNCITIKTVMLKNCQRSI